MAPARRFTHGALVLGWVFATVMVLPTAEWSQSVTGGVGGDPSAAWMLVRPQSRLSLRRVRIGIDVPLALVYDDDARSVALAGGSLDTSRVAGWIERFAFAIDGFSLDAGRIGLQSSEHGLVLDHWIASHDPLLPRAALRVGLRTERVVVTAWAADPGDVPMVAAEVIGAPFSTATPFARWLRLGLSGGLDPGTVESTPGPVDGQLSGYLSYRYATDGGVILEPLVALAARTAAMGFWGLNVAFGDPSLRVQTRWLFGYAPSPGAPEPFDFGQQMERRDVAWAPSPRAVVPQVEGFEVRGATSVTWQRGSAAAVVRRRTDSRWDVLLTGGYERRRLRLAVTYASRAVGDGTHLVDGARVYGAVEGGVAIVDGLFVTGRIGQQWRQNGRSATTEWLGFVGLGYGIASIW